MDVWDFIVVGAGIAGASAAYELAVHGRVLVLEREDQPGYHSTGRSAAIFSETYGGATVRALTMAGRGFFASPPPGFGEQPLWSARGVLFIGRQDQLPALVRHHAEVRGLVDSVRMIDATEVLRMVPSLRTEYAAAGVHEPDAMELNVPALHHGYLRGLKARNGRLETAAEVLGLERGDGSWRVRTASATHSAPIVVNAAGAWADQLAVMAGASPLGVKPLRRTVIVFPAAPGTDPSAWPMVVDADEEFYFKAEAGKILASPADETPVEPCDVQPEEMDIAITVDRIHTATTLEIPRIDGKWAGLRTFVGDRAPVAGFDGDREGFLWLAGQGGYGIQTAPSMGRICAALAAGRGIPADIAELGVTEAALSPARFKPPGDTKVDTKGDTKGSTKEGNGQG